MARQTIPLEKMIKDLPPDLRQEVYEFVQSLLKKRAAKPKRKFKLDWAGGLSKYRDQYTSLELQKKAMDWWDEDVPGR